MKKLINFTLLFSCIAAAPVQCNIGKYETTEYNQSIAQLTINTKPIDDMVEQLLKVQQTINSIPKEIIGQLSFTGLGFFGVFTGAVVLYKQLYANTWNKWDYIRTFIGAATIIAGVSTLTNVNKLTERCYL